MKKESSFKMKGFSGFSNKIDMTLNDKLNKAVRKRSASYAMPRVESQKARGTKQIVGRGVVSKKPASFASKAFRGFKNLAKGLGRRSLGISGMMMGTMGTALGNTNQGIGFKGEGSARRLFNKRKKK